MKIFLLIFLSIKLYAMQSSDEVIDDAPQTATPPPVIYSPQPRRPQRIPLDRMPFGWDIELKPIRRECIDMPLDAAAVQKVDDKMLKCSPKDQHMYLHLLALRNSITHQVLSPRKSNEFKG